VCGQVYYRILLSKKEKLNYVTCRKMDRTEDHIILSEINQAQKTKYHSFVEPRLKIIMIMVVVVEAVVMAMVMIMGRKYKKRTVGG
jgi:hypothetical protein